MGNQSTQKVSRRPSGGAISSGVSREAPEYYLAALNRQNRENMNAALRPFGLKIADWRLLHCLDGVPSLTINDLADLTVIDRSVASRLIDRLIERGLLCKSASDADRRFAQISLTGDGRRKLRDADPAVGDLRAQLFSGLSEVERDEFLRVLQLLRKNALGYQRWPAPSFAE